MSNILVPCRAPQALRPAPGDAYAACRAASVVYGIIQPEQLNPPIPYLVTQAFSQRWPEGRRSWVNEQAITHRLSTAEFDAAREAGWPAEPAALHALLAGAAEVSA